jgi:cyclophilin family peptidyl-prolyl cis-trans isomerase
MAPVMSQFIAPNISLTKTLLADAHAGLLSIANSGKDTNSSQFFVTLKPARHQDGKHVVFGQVMSGMDVIRAIARVPTDLYEHPRVPVHIFDCAQMSTNGLHPLKDMVTDQD